MVALAVGLALVSAPGWAVFDEQKKAGDPTEPAMSAEVQSALNAALAEVKKADAAAGESSRKLPAAAKDAYSKARELFSAVTIADASLAQAWNGVGYTNRKLGDYKAALTAYDKAIELRMGYPEATEYRGEAYLALNRTEDAKQAYLDLFAVNRELAAKLLESMKKWTASSGKKKDDVEDMKDFIQERTQIAAQTASLTREATTQGWN